MPCFKPAHWSLKLLPVDFDRQIQPDSSELALYHLLGISLDLCTFHARYTSDTA